MKWVEEWKRKKRVKKYLTEDLGEIPTIKCVEWGCTVKPEEYDLSKWEKFKISFNVEWFSFWEFGFCGVCIVLDLSSIISILISCILDIIGIFSTIPVIIGLVLFIISIIITMIHFLMDWLGVFVNNDKLF